MRCDKRGTGLSDRPTDAATLEERTDDIRAVMDAIEVELDGDAIRGIAVHTAARVCGAAGGGDLFVSSTVRDLAAGSGIVFEDRGLFELKGIPDRRQLFSVSG